MKIAQKYRGLRTCDYQYKKYQKQKSKHVIHLTRPEKN